MNERGPRQILITIDTHHYIWWPALRVVERRQKGKSKTLPETEIHLKYNNNTESGAMRAALKDLNKLLTERIMKERARLNN